MIWKILGLLLVVVIVLRGMILKLNKLGKNYVSPATPRTALKFHLNNRQYTYMIVDDTNNYKHIIVFMNGFLYRTSWYTKHPNKEKLKKYQDDMYTKTLKEIKQHENGNRD